VWGRPGNRSLYHDYTQGKVLNIAKKISISKECYLEFSAYAIKRVCAPKSSSKSFWFNLILWCALTIIIMTIMQIDKVDLEKLHWPSAVIGAAPFLLLLCAYLFNVSKFKKLTIPNENGIVLGGKTLEFTPDGIKENSSLGHSFFAWTSVEEITENKGNIYIFIDKLYAVIVPASAFNAVEEAEEFKALIEKYV
jgi:hypothetical protein